MGWGLLILPVIFIGMSAAKLMLDPDEFAAGSSLFSEVMCSIWAAATWSDAAGRLEYPEKISFLIKNFSIGCPGGAPGS